MRKILLVCSMLLASSGCGPEWEMRKEPDMLRIDPKRASKLHDIRIEAGYTPRVSDRANWQIHSTLANVPALDDNDPTTIATSTADHRKREWILIDLGCVCHFQNVRQLHPPDSGEPPGYRVDTAGDQGFPFTLQYVGAGEPNSSVATFPRAVNARFIRITVIDDSPAPWAVAEIELF